jgi:excinuclease ABC subunit C
MTNITTCLKALRQIFRIRSCRVAFARNNGKLEIISKAGRSIPCLDYYIGICPAPCMLESEKLDVHSKNIESLKDFLKGNTGKVLVDLESQMREKAKALQFEEAAKIKTQIESIREISVKQIARDTISGDADAFVFLEKYERIFAGIAQIRGGEIVSVRNVEIETRL